MKITAEQLRLAAANDPDVSALLAEWPDGVEITPDNCLRAMAIGFNIDRAAEYLMSESTKDTYVDLAKSAKEEFNATKAEAQKTCEHIKGPAQREYERKRDAAWSKFTPKLAVAFCTAIDQQVETLTY